MRVHNSIIIIFFIRLYIKIHRKEYCVRPLCLCFIIYDDVCEEINDFLGCTYLNMNIIIFGFVLHPRVLNNENNNIYLLYIILLYAYVLTTYLPNIISITLSILQSNDTICFSVFKYLLARIRTYYYYGIIKRQPKDSRGGLKKKIKN